MNIDKFEERAKEVIVENNLFVPCDDNKMPLLDLKDIKKVINYITEEGKTEIEQYRAESYKVLRKFNTYESKQIITKFNEQIETAKKLAKCEIGSGHDNWLNGIVVQFDLSCSNKM